MGKQVAGFEAIPRRIRIGVTGHRKVTDPVALQALVRKAIDSEVADLFAKESRDIIEGAHRSGRSALSYSVLSPLAEGADRVVARAVLEYPNARLHVVLPLTPEDYLEDFASEGSRKEFEELLGQCSRPVLMRTRSIQDERRDACDQAELRKDAYAQVGRYVVDHSDVLIAVWAGEPARDRGGTAEIIQYALERNLPIIRVWGGSIKVMNRGKSQIVSV